MSSRTATALAIAFVLIGGLRAAYTAYAITPAQKAKLVKMQERPAIVGRDTTSVPGAIIEHWDPPFINADGEAEYYRTNAIVRIVGEKQPTTWSKVREELEARAEAAEGDAKAVRDVRKAAKRAEKNLSKIVKTIEQAKKKASTAEETELYDLILAMLKVEEES